MLDPRPWRHRTFGAVLSVLTVCVSTEAIQLYGQSPGNLTQQESGEIRQVSLASDAGIVAARLEASRATQIRVTVKFLMLDDETRASIYRDLGAAAIKNSTTKIPLSPPHDIAPETTSHLECSEVIGTTSRVSTSVLNRSASESILKMIAESSRSSVDKTPSIILLDGKDAEFSDISQRPFVIDVERTEDGLKPIIQVCEEGTTVRLNASLSDSPAGGPPQIQLKSEIGWRTILDVTTEQIFGVEQEATNIQVPRQAIKIAIVVEQLAAGQALLVDPYVTKSVSYQPESSGSVLKRFPYLGRHKKNVEQETEDRHVLLLLQPNVE